MGLSSAWTFRPRAALALSAALAQSNIRRISACRNLMFWNSAA